jgi:hypothetical protein
MADMQGARAMVEKPSPTLGLTRLHRCARVAGEIPSAEIDGRSRIRMLPIKNEGLGAPGPVNKPKKARAKP